MVFYKVIVCPLPFYEGGMIAGFNYFAAIKDDDLVCVLDGGETVGNYNDRATFVEFIEVFYDGSFVFGVESVGGFVEEYEVGVLVDGASYEDSLLLPLAETDSVLANLGIVFSLKGTYRQRLI